MIDNSNVKKQANQGRKKEVNRGTKDEFETIALIVSEVSHIREAVLRRLEAVQQSQASSGVQQPQAVAPSKANAGKT